jgi:membrane protein YdbS with pleckstrin-like domain
MVDILGYPDEVRTALETKRATGAIVAVVQVQTLDDGRLVVGVDITEPTTAVAIPLPMPVLRPVPWSVRWWYALKQRAISAWKRLWASCGPEPLEDILHPGEHCRIWKHRHWFLPARSVLRALAGLPVALVLTYLLKTLAEEMWWLHVIVWLIPVMNAIQMGYRVLVWLADRIIVTDQRLILADGILNRRIQAIPLGRIRGIDVNRTFAGRVFGYGTFKIGYPNYDLEPGSMVLPAGTIEFVPSPKKVYRATGLGKA